MGPLRILADANIPAALDAFGPFGTVRLVSGRDITRDSVADADVLLVRSVTPVDAALVEGTPVRFVGTATAGVDHVDQAALARLGIAFASAPGSNATSVVEYVLAALLDLADERGTDVSALTLGVVGAGQVGGRLVPRARALGMDVLVCDPPRAAAGATEYRYVSLGAVLAGADVVTLHTPLTGPDASPWPTRGLIGEAELAAMRPGAWLVNAARGPVTDGPALLAARRSGHLGALVLDCWPGEPAPDLDLVEAADIATPHVAGYSFDGKVAGTVTLDAALRGWLAGQGDSVREPWDATGALAEPTPLVAAAPPLPEDTPEARTAWLHGLVRQAYDVRADDARFRELVGAEPDPGRRAAAFADLRRTYPRRREWSAWTVRGHVPERLRRAVTEGLGMRIGGGTAG
jgi:erythronate-4-phosphate dehydrogenase